jgi:3',5'-cyclic AMP phosphodiesterase CpdA
MKCFRDSLAGRKSCACGKGIQRKEARFDDFAVCLLGHCLREMTDDVDRDMIAPRGPAVEIDSQQHNGPGEMDIAFLPQLLCQRRFEGFARLHAATGHMPACHIGMAHKENSTLSIKHHGPHTQCHAARDAGAEKKCHLRKAEQAARLSRIMRLIVGHGITMVRCIGNSQWRLNPPLDLGGATMDSGARFIWSVLLSFLLAHLSDPHVGPIHPPRLRELAGKRLTGYVNWKRGRSLIHDMDMLERITADMLEHQPDHVALTGDLVNLGLESEFVTAQRYVARVGDPAFVSVVPGNHDAYARSSYKYMAASAAPWMTGDGATVPAFPYVRIRDGVALIGLSSGVPTAPLLASGQLGEKQLKALGMLLREAGEEGLARVLMIHHPPTRKGASYGRGLRDAAAFEALIRAHGAELVLHGHNHRQSVLRIAGPHGPVPVVGVASASAIPGRPTHLASYHLYKIARQGARLSITMQVRGLLASGAIGDAGSEKLV